MRVLIRTACLSFCFCISVLAETYVVCPDGSGDFPNIQSAIDAAVDGDVVALTDGTFTGEGNRDIDYRGKEVTVRSLKGIPEACVVDCEGSDTDPHCGFHFRTTEPVESVLSGVTVTGGWAVYPDYGGAVRCEGGSSPTIESCIFLGHGGSAVGCYAGTLLPVTDCSFVGNVAGSGGGALWSEKASYTHVRNCTFWGNSSPDGTVLAGNHRLAMTNTIVAFSAQGPGVASFEDYAELACCDIFGNAGGPGVRCRRGVAGRLQRDAGDAEHVGRDQGSLLP